VLSQASKNSASGRGGQHGRCFKATGRIREFRNSFEFYSYLWLHTCIRDLDLIFHDHAGMAKPQAFCRFAATNKP
jgi:hypothetical protein